MQTRYEPDQRIILEFEGSGLREVFEIDIRSYYYEFFFFGDSKKFVWNIHCNLEDQSVIERFYDDDGNAGEDEYKFSTKEILDGFIKDFLDYDCTELRGRYIVIRCLSNPSGKTLSNHSLRYNPVPDRVCDDFLTNAVWKFLKPEF